PLTILKPFDAKYAKPGQSLLMVSTTGEQFAYFELDEALRPVEKNLPQRLAVSVERIAENCEPSVCSVLFMAGAGGSLRSGVTDNPVRLTRSVADMVTYVSCGGAPVTIWPGGGITLMVDVCRMPENSFGYVPTPALVAPIEFTMRLADYELLGGHMDAVRPIGEVADAARLLPQADDNPWPAAGSHFRWGKGGTA
ncbi:MAG: 6-hydroxynicotinate reductase, partial [Hyphomicrobiales bacterium]